MAPPDTRQSLTVAPDERDSEHGRRPEWPWTGRPADLIRAALAATLAIGCLVGVFIAPTADEKAFAALAMLVAAWVAYVMTRR